MMTFIDPQRLRVWASWCAMQGLRTELQGALLDAASEIERLQRQLYQREVNGENHASHNGTEMNNEVLR